eukprot:2729904-Amphidinium_carterae.1
MSEVALSGLISELAQLNRTCKDKLVSCPSSQARPFYTANKGIDSCGCASRETFSNTECHKLKIR